MSKQASLAPSTSPDSLKLFRQENRPSKTSSVRPSVESLGKDQDFQNAVARVLSKSPEFVVALDTLKSKLKEEYGSFEAALEHGNENDFKKIIASTPGLVKFENALINELIIPSDEKKQDWLIKDRSTTESPSRNDIRALSAPV